MPSRDVRNREPRFEKDDWVVSCTRKGGANIILWGMPRSLSSLEIPEKLADIGLARFAMGSMRWEGDHVRMVVKPEDDRGLTKEAY